MRRVCMSLTLAVFLPLSAWADPVSANLYSANGAIVSVSPSTNGVHIDLGQLQLAGAESSALFLFGGLNVYTDYTVPVEIIRQELQRFVENQPLWDRRVCVLQVTDSKERTLELRCLVSASNSSRAFDLRCAVREHLVTFIQEHHPEALPKTRSVLEAQDRPFTLAPETE